MWQRAIAWTQGYPKIWYLLQPSGEGGAGEVKKKRRVVVEITGIDHEKRERERESPFSNINKRERERERERERIGALNICAALI